MTFAESWRVLVSLAYRGALKLDQVLKGARLARKLRPPTTFGHAVFGTASRSALGYDASLDDACAHRCHTCIQRPVAEVPVAVPITHCGALASGAGWPANHAVDLSTKFLSRRSSVSTGSCSESVNIAVAWRGWAARPGVRIDTVWSPLPIASQRSATADRSATYQIRPKFSISTTGHRQRGLAIPLLPFLAIH